jgi:hypothetical protein
MIVELDFERPKRAFLWTKPRKVRRLRFDPNDPNPIRSGDLVYIDASGVVRRYVSAPYPYPADWIINLMFRPVYGLALVSASEVKKTPHLSTHLLVAKLTPDDLVVISKLNTSRTIVPPTDSDVGKPFWVGLSGNGLMGAALNLDYGINPHGQVVDIYPRRTHLVVRFYEAVFIVSTL